ncbi:MAG: MBL fold metallo-hydrolase [Bdellovibrionales bacterium]
MKAAVQEFFDPATSTLTYVAFDANSRDAVVIDPVWDYEPASSTLSKESSDRLIHYIRQNELKLHFILETHAHADHVSGAQILKAAFPNTKVAIGTLIQEVQQTFKKIYHFEKEFPTDGRQFDLLLEDGSTLKAGTLSIKTISTPGHTPACASYLIGDALFTGDALFMPDSGVGRCDFPAGSAKQLYDSIHGKLYQLPDSTRVFVGHDYQPGGRSLQFQSTIGTQKKSNIQLRAETTKEEFVEFRTKRDATLSAPRLLLPSLQININAGHLFPPESDGKVYLKIPLSIKN